MTRSSDKGNQGIIVTGGTLSADNLAVGNNASLSNGSHKGTDAEVELQQLRIEVSKLIEYMENSKLDMEQIKAAKVAKTELESNSPNLFLAKSVLFSVIDGVKAIGSVAGSIMSIKKLFGVLLP